MTDLFVLCAGGHARVAIDILRRSGRTVTGLYDDNPDLHGKNIDGVPVLGGHNLIMARAVADTELVNALGNIARRGGSGLGQRRDFYLSFHDKGYRFAQVISPEAYIAQSAVLEEGCHVITGAIVHPGCTVGVNSIVNTGAQLDHDCRVGAHCHIAPGAVLCGGVTVGDGTHVGAGAVVVQGITIGAGALIAGGAVVTQNIAPGATFLGSK